MASLPNTKVTPKTWDKKYPLSDLPVDKTWDGEYLKSYSCVGFAKMVLDATYGTGSAIGAAPTSGTYTTSDTSKLATALGSYSVGDRITFQFRGKTGDYDQHSMIITKKGTSDIEVYDCNSDNKGTIKKYTITHTTLLTKYDKIRGGVKHK